MEEIILVEEIILILGRSRDVLLVRSFACLLKSLRMKAGLCRKEDICLEIRKRTQI